MERKTHKRSTTVVRLVLRLPNEINESKMTPGPPRETHSLYKISDFDVEVQKHTPLGPALQALWREPSVMSNK